MKKVLSLVLCIAIVFSAVIAIPLPASASGVVYYIDSINGNNSNNGTSPSTPWKTLDKINATTFQPGDSILFKSGGVWNGMLWPKGSGTSGNPIIISSYGGTVKPIINGGGLGAAYGTVYLKNQQYWEISNLEITNDDNFTVENTNGSDRNGILVVLDGSLGEGTYHHIYVSNCYIHDVDGSSNWNGRGTGAIVYEITGPQLNYLTKFNDIRIENNIIRKADLLGILVCPIGTGASETTLQSNNQYSTNIYIGHNVIQDVGQGGIQINECKDTMVEYNLVDGFIRRYSRAAVGAYPYLSVNTTFQYNEVCNGPASNPDGTAFDFDAYCENTLYQYNYSHNNPCGFLLLMGRNYNDVARYNISQNDGGYLFKYCLWDQLSPAKIYNNVFYYDSATTAMQNSELFAN